MASTATHVYDRRKTRRALLLAPAAASLGVLPFMLQLNLGVGQFLFAIVFILLLSYLLGLLLGAPGYWVLKKFNLHASRYLLVYAAGLSLLTPILLGDRYALLSFGPPIMLAAAAFCWLRGPAQPTGSA